MLKLWLAATMVVAMMSGVATAQISSSVGPTGSQQPNIGEPLTTSGSEASVTGYLGLMATTTIPVSGNQGPPIFNSYDTGMIVPGQPPRLMSTPE